MSDDHTDLVLSVREAAIQLDRSTEQVRRYLREGRLDGRRIGGQWFIDRSALDAFTASSKVEESFVDSLDLARTIRPLDDVIGIGAGPGANMAEGKHSYRLRDTRRR